MIQDHFGDGSRFHCQIEYLHEDKELGTGGALSLLPASVQSPVLLMNGDLLTMINITRLLDFHKTGKHAVTMALRVHKVQIPFGVAETEGTLVKELVEKPTLDYRINAGIYVISPEILRLVPKDEFFPVTNLIARCLDENKTVGAYDLQETWKDIGLPDEYWAAHNL
jgi:NDP-sugar pyrophosphorylase family protein